MSHQDVLHGSNLDLLAAVRDNFAHAVVTDPPYGLGFMGKDWDAALPDPRTWSECLRVLRPGGHLVAFGAPRLVHRLTCQIEDAGFEIRDQLLWLFGSGFPKSLDVSKAIDASAGAVREVVGPSVRADGTTRPNAETWATGLGYESGALGVARNITAPATPEAARWSGWGTALKPAYEPIVLARKPLDGTVAQTVQRWGTGALNIDGCRVEHASENDRDKAHASAVSLANASAPRGTYAPHASYAPVLPAGRWPANLILDEGAGALLDQQSGTSKSTQGKPRKGAPGEGYGMTHTGAEHSDSGGASRFFARVDFGEVDRFMYCPKASRSEREAGLRHLPARVVHEAHGDAARRHSAGALRRERDDAGRVRAGGRGLSRDGA